MFAVGYLVLSGLFIAPAWAGGPWEITTIDTSGDVGDHSSLAILPSGRPAISYFDLRNSTLKYAWLDVDGWQTTTVDSDGHVGENTSIVILPSGNPAISYHDVQRDDLKYAWFEGKGWHTSVVDGADGGFMGATGTSMAVLPSGHPAISYRDHWNGWLKYAWFDGDTWSTTVVDDEGNVGHESSLAILPSGHPAISYIDTTNDRLMYTWFNGRKWQKTVAAQPGGTGTSLAILPSGQPAIVHDASGGIRYVWFDGDRWNSTEVDSVSGWESWFGYAGFAIQPSGEPAMCYVRRQFPDRPELKFTWFEDDAWRTTSVMVGGAAKSSLAFLPSGKPAIAFRDSRNLMYATSKGCSGEPKIRKAKCTNNHKLIVKLKGDPNDTFVANLENGRRDQGQLSDRGKGKAKFRNMPGGIGFVRVIWGCGEVAVAPYDCR